jgi:hypothetical protein
MPPSVTPGGIAVCDVAWLDDGNGYHVPDQERGVGLTTDAMQPTTDALPLQRTRTRRQRLL